MDKGFIKSFLKGSVAASIGQFASIGFHFLSIMILTRYMPKEEFGIYLLILVVVHLLKILSGLGLDLTLVKFIAAGEGEAGKGVLGTVLALRAILLLILGVAVVGVGHLLMPLLDERINEYLLFIPLIVFLASFRELFFFLFQGLKQFKHYAIVQTLSALFKFGLILLAFWTEQLSIEILLYIEIIAFGISLVVQIALTPMQRLGGYSMNTESVNALLQFGLPLYANNILTFLYGRVNVFIIGAFLNPASIASFEVAGNIPGGFARVFKSFIVVYFPNLASLFAEGKLRDAEKVMNKSLGICAALLGLLMLAAFALREEIMTLIFSENYREAALAFALLMLSFMLHAQANIMGYSLVSAGHSAVPVKANIISSLINLALSIVLIPKYGYIGAVYAVIAMNAVSQVVYLWFLRKNDIHADIANYLKPLLLALVLLVPFMLIGEVSVWLRLLLPLSYVLIAAVVLEDFRKLIDFLLKRNSDKDISTESAS